MAMRTTRGIYRSRTRPQSRLARRSIATMTAVTAPPASGYAPMDVIWLFSLLLCALGTLPLDILLLGIR